MARDEDRRPVRPLTSRIAPVIKGFMREHGITQAGLGNELERDQSYISERVTGKRPFTTDELDALAKLAGLEPREFLAEITSRLRNAPTIDLDEHRKKRRVARPREDLETAELDSTKVAATTDNTPVRPERGEK